MASARKSSPSVVPSQAVVQSHAESNRELAEAFERYLVSRGFSRPTEPLRGDVAFKERERSSPECLGSKRDRAGSKSGPRTWGRIFVQLQVPL
jgi:hypothetical protein